MAQCTSEAGGACLPLVRTNDSSSSCRFPVKVIPALVLIKAAAGFAVHARTLQL